MAQDAFRHSLAGERAVRRQTLTPPNYNIRFKNVSFLVESSLRLELNDNVRYNDSDTEDIQEDLILTPELSTRVHWPITERNALNFSLGIGYNKYINHSEYDYLLITPGSQLSWDIFVKDFRFTFFDRFSYTQDPGQNAAIAGVARYGGLDNSAGVNAVWDLNDLVINLGYAHQNFIPDQEEFEYLTRSSELLVARGAFLLDNGIALGPEATASFVSYDEPILNNAFAYSIGGFAEAQLSPHMRVGAHAGFVSYEFEESGQSIPQEHPKTYYFSVDLNHRINEYIRHTLSGGRDIESGTFSDFREEFYGRYAIDWNIIRNVRLGTAFYFEHGRVPSLVIQQGATLRRFLNEETYDRFGASVSASYQLMQKLRTTLAYRFTIRDSDLQFRDYTQNALTLGFIYRF